MKKTDYINNDELPYDPEDEKSTKFINTFYELSYEKYIENIPNIFNRIKIKEISCGNAFTLILDDNGDVYSFGKNDEGQLGYLLDYSEYEIINSKKANLIPKKIDYFTNKDIKINKIICGSNFSFVLDENEIIYSFGDNSCEQLARETPNFSSYSNPAEANYLKNFGKITQIKLGWSFGAFLNEFGEVYIWGNIFQDYKKALNLKDVKFPKNIFLGKDDLKDFKFREISCGFSHLLAIGYNEETKENKLLSYGSNEFVKLKI